MVMSGLHSAWNLGKTFLTFARCDVCSLRPVQDKWRTLCCFYHRQNEGGFVITTQAILTLPVAQAYTITQICRRFWRLSWEIHVWVFLGKDSLKLTIRLLKVVLLSAFVCLELFCNQHFQKRRLLRYVWIWTQTCNLRGKMKRISSCHFLRIYHMGILLYCYYLVLKYHQTNINIKSWYQIRGLVPQTGTSKLVSSTLRATTRHLCCHEVLYLGPWDMFYCSPWDSYIHSDMIRYYLFRQDHFLACINFGYLL